MTLWAVKASPHIESKLSFSWALLKCSTFLKSSNILFNIIRVLPVELKIEYILVTHQMNKPIQTLSQVKRQKFFENIFLVGLACLSTALTLVLPSACDPR